jgi:hypothetical protein
VFAAMPKIIEELCRDSSLGLLAHYGDMPIFGLAAATGPGP